MRSFVNRNGELAELAALTELLDDGRGRTVALSGPAGQGKSALLERWVAGLDGVDVLAARGVESETELPFAGLAELLVPVLPRIDELPDPQPAALRAALALGPATGGDRFTVFMALVGLLALVASDRPLVVVVDDAHHLDASTLDALAFASRRLGDDPVLVVLVGRDDALATASLAHAVRLELGPLAADDARQVLHRAAPTAIHPAVASRLLDAAGGNPSALVDLATVLDLDELRGRVPLAEPLPIGADLEAAFGRQVARLPPSARQALLLLAVGAADGPDDLDRALTASRLSVDDLVVAERAGLVQLVAGRYRFRTPLVRSAAYHRASPPDRRAAHQAFAEAARPGSAPQAWHLAAAAVGPAEAVAAAMERAAVEAAERGDAATSWHAWERAAHLTPPGTGRGRRTLGAVAAALAAGSPDAAERLLTEVGVDLDDDDRTLADRLRGRLLVVTGRPDAAAEELAERAEARAGQDPVVAAALLLEVVPAMIRDGRVTTALHLARRCAELAPPTGRDDRIEARAAVALGAALVAAGDVDAARPLLDRHLDVVALEGRVAAAPFLADTEALARIRLGEYDAARTLLDHLADAIGAASAPGAVPGVLAVQGFLDYRTGRLAEAAAACTAAVQLADETRQQGLVAFPLATLATVQALRGDEASCREAAERLERLGDVQEGGRGFEIVARSAVGLLELGLGRPDAAVRVLEPLAARLDRARPSVVMWEGDLAEALIRTGRADDADPVIALLASAAARADDERAAATVARLRALRAPDDRRDDASQDAIARYRHLGLDFGLARALLDHGGWLRRARRRKAARPHLEEAFDRFQAMGADAWAALAATELDRCGAPRPSSGTTDPLTPQERQVATLVAAGSSNREVSARLFVSVRTVESHLSRIYRKLGLRSRSELAAWFTREAPTAPAP